MTKKEHFNTFTISDEHNMGLDEIKQHALDAALRREEIDDHSYDDIEVEVSPFIERTLRVYDVKVYGVPTCRHPIEKITIWKSGNAKDTASYECECGAKMKIKAFEVDNEKETI